MCLAGSVVGVAGSSPFTVMTNILSLNSANSMKNLTQLCLQKTTRKAVFTLSAVHCNCCSKLTKLFFFFKYFLKRKYKKCENCILANLICHINTAAFYYRQKG